VGVFGWANNAGIMQCSKECSMGNTFNPFMYSLDVLLPVINFHQKDYFFPDATKLYGYLVRWYFWMQIAFGWVFSAWVAIVKTDLFRKLLGKE